MDKADFIRLAPTYYELAVLLLVWERDGFYSEGDIEEPYIIEDEASHDSTNLLHSDKLLSGAIEALIAKGAIDAIEDPFGPTLYKRSAGINKLIEELQEDESSAFHKSSLASNRKRWVIGALWKVYYTYRDLGLTDADFDAPEQEWQPLPLDRRSEEVTTAIAAIDETIKVVKGSNGYAETHPEERNWVLDNLDMLSRRLKTANTITVAYVKKHGFEIAEKLRLRFRDDVIGEASKALFRALKELLNFLF